MLSLNWFCTAYDANENNKSAIAISQTHFHVKIYGLNVYCVIWMEMS